MAADSPQLKCPLDNHSQENAVEAQCYLIEVKRLIKEFHSPVATGLRTNVFIVDEVQTGDGATEHVHAFSLGYLRSTPSTFRTLVFVARAKSFDVNIGGSSHRKIQHMHKAYDMEILCSSSLVLLVSSLRIIFCISIEKRRNDPCSVPDPSRVPNKESGLDDLEHYRNTCPYGRPADVFDYQGTYSTTGWTLASYNPGGKRERTALWYLSSKVDKVKWRNIGPFTSMGNDELEQLSQLRERRLAWLAACTSARLYAQELFDFRYFINKLNQYTLYPS
ncbi:hypothetical protein N7449_011017 [Penicillium cf. viridicatum]|uniref:Uncharacterized protein n=1 Tax=Penicillium cf. viridicatum TaxID=2972119 RepID=A0A9W9IW94_9EURO|nr:hypothetical protein N7449_011017 [Penicillium cf. viridicatum]